MHIRNGVYLGPVKFYFNGKFSWTEKSSMLSFMFDDVNLELVGIITEAAGIRAHSMHAAQDEMQRTCPAGPSGPLHLPGWG